MTEANNHVRTALFLKGKSRMDQLINERGLLVSEMRSGRRLPLTEKTTPELATLIISLTTDGARAKLSEVTCNEYWLIYLVCTAASQCDQFPLSADDIEDARDILQRAYSNQDLLKRVLTGCFHELSPAEMELATNEGLIVTDETWPFPDDQRLINPLFV